MEEKIAREPLEVKNVFNIFFANAGDTGLALAFLIASGQLSPAESMFLNNISEREVSKAILDLKAYKSADVNDLPTWLLKLCKSALRVRSLNQSIFFTTQAFFQIL